MQRHISLNFINVTTRLKNFPPVRKAKKENHPLQQSSIALKKIINFPAHKLDNFYSRSPDRQPVFAEKTRARNALKTS